MSTTSKLERSPLGRGAFREKPPKAKQRDLLPSLTHVEILKTLNVFPLLSSFYLYEIATDLSYDAFKESIKQLWYRGYVYRPRQQIETTNADYNQYVYALTEKGEKYLKQHGLWVEAVKPTGPWKHQFMVSTTLATLKHLSDKNGYRFIPPHEYLRNVTRENPLRIPELPFKWDKQTVKMPLEPDAICAIDYGDGAIAYAIEADRATEPTIATDLKKKSYKRMVAQYKALLSNRTHHKYYPHDNPPPMMLLFVTVEQGRVRAFLDLVEKSPFFTALAIPEFGTFFKPPDLLTERFEKPLERAGKEPWYIKREAAPE